MHTRIKQAYENVYLDNDTKKRVLNKIELSAMEKDISEEGKVIQVPNVVASLAVAFTLTVVGLFVLKGCASMDNPHTMAGKVDITATPKSSVGAVSANPEATESGKKDQVLNEKIKITKQEFEAGIVKMKKAVFGVAMPCPIYSSDDLIIINDYWGMLFYDNKEHKALGVLDTAKYDINHIQGSDYTEIRVSKSGDYISFCNTEMKEAKYLFDLKNLTLEKGKSIEDMEVYDGIAPSDSKVDSFWQQQIGNQYVLGDQAALLNDGKYVWCGLDLIGWKESDGEITMDRLVIIKTWDEKIKDSYKHHFDIVNIK